MARKLRLLPVLIFLGALTLTLKLGDIWQVVHLDGPAPASAAGDEAKENDTAQAKPASKPGGPEDGAQATKPSEDPETSGRAFDPARVTNAEMEVLEKLAERREALEQRARDLDMRETLLRATETRIDGKIGELRKIKATIEGLLKKHDAQEEAKMKSLVKIYESMKPKDAARIFEQLDLAVLLNVVERMRERSTAPILAEMTPAKAKTVTSALAERRALPELSEKASASTGNARR